MPPPGARQPDAAAVDSLVAWLEDSLDRAAGQAHVPDQVVLHRLNRKEYTNAVRDLLAVDFDATRGAAGRRRVAEGFDNIADGAAGVAVVHRAVRDRRARGGREGGGPAGCATRRVDVPRRTRHAAHARARSSARHARRHPRQRRSPVRRRISSSTSPTWPPTSGATGWSSRTRSWSRSTTRSSTRR